MTPTALTDDILIYQKDYLENTKSVYRKIIRLKQFSNMNGHTISNKKLHFYMMQLRKCNL